MINKTVFLTVLSGVITYVFGQLVLKLLIEPVQETKKLIGQISHSLTEHANVIQNPGVLEQEVMKNSSQHLRKLSAQLESQLYIVPIYTVTAFIFRLPPRKKILSAARSLMGLSNSVFRAKDGIYEQNSRRVENIHDSLGLYMAEGDRWPEENI